MSQGITVQLGMQYAAPAPRVRTATPQHPVRAPAVCQVDSATLRVLTRPPALMLAQRAGTGLEAPTALRVTVLATRGGGGRRGSPQACAVVHVALGE